MTSHGSLLWIMLSEKDSSCYDVGGTVWSSTTHDAGEFWSLITACNPPPPLSTWHDRITGNRVNHVTDRWPTAVTSPVTSHGDMFTPIAIRSSVASLPLSQSRHLSVIISPIFVRRIKLDNMSVLNHTLRVVFAISVYAWSYHPLIYSDG